jgi:hypothetical protein
MRKLHQAVASAAIGLAAVSAVTGCAAGATKVIVITASPAAAVTRVSTQSTAVAAAPVTVARSRTRPARRAPITTTARRPVATYVDPVTVVQKFYTDLNSRDFQAAYAIGGYNTFGGNDYQRWVAGYADTTGVIGHASDAGNGVVDTSFEAYHTDGSVQTYAGTYTVRNGVIVAGHMHLV